MTKNKSFLLPLLFYLIFIFGLTIFSYSQVDLNLTLSTGRIFQTFQKQMIDIGYFRRPLSTLLLFLLIFITTALYTVILKAASSGKLNLKILKYLIVVSLFLIFAYPAFSHDIFNYMFDARIVTKYHLSPYYFKALDFPVDPWTRFMHWTHRYFPYGIGWLAVTLVPSFIGMGKFVPTLLLFKLMFVVFHILNCFMIYKISQKLNSKSAIFATAFYAFNPLIIFEGLVSPHNEILMLSFLLFFIYFLLTKNLIKAVLALFISISIKFMTVIFLPLAVIWPGKISGILKYGFYLWLLALIPVIINREIYAWYFIPLVGIGALICGSRTVIMIITGLSIGTVLRYLPYFYYGDYGKLTVIYQNRLLITGILAGLLLGIYIWNEKLSAD